MSESLFPCPRCGGSGWAVSNYQVCDCRAGDYAWAKWEGMSIEEYDDRARGTSNYHGPDPAYMMP